MQTLTGKDLMKQNVKREAHRLQLYNTCIIGLATDQIWRRLKPQKRKFKKLANHANNIHTIVQMSAQQITRNPLANEFFNGTTSFHENNSHDYFFYSLFSVAIVYELLFHSYDLEFIL